ncbi:MAG: VWA domain-containing protein [Puniceicoccaceae bacterium]|nr:VWA domain-containing protein [Puniceicoccaceae bacterium]
MTFASPTWLYIAVLLIVAFSLLLAYGLRKRDWLLSRFAAERLLLQLTTKTSQKRLLLRALCILIAVAFIGVALARPQYGVEWTERKARSLDIVFALDSSKSMLATDLRPTRLDRAKLAILDLVERLESDRVGLIVFAGSAFLQTPPTLDYSAFRESLTSIDPKIMTIGGSNLGSAIEEAAKAFPPDNNVKIVVLLTDGEDLTGEALKAAEKVTTEGIKIYTIGIGTKEGEYLKNRKEDGSEHFVRDSQGQPVRSQLDELTLKEIANITKASYCQLNDQSLEQLYNSVIANLPRKERESELQELRIERYQWALAVAFIFLLLEMTVLRHKRMKNMVTILVSSLIFIPSQSKGAGEILNDLTNDMELSKDLDNNMESLGGNPSTLDAREIFNSAHQMLKQEKYALAEKTLAQVVRSTTDLRLQRDALYNMGHSNFQLGEKAYQSQDYAAAIKNWKTSEALFNSASEIDRTDLAANQDAEDVRLRREALEAYLQDQEQQQQQNQESDQNQENPSTQDEQNQENNQSSEDSNNSESAQDSQRQEQEQQQQQNSTEEASTQSSVEDRAQADSEQSDNPTLPESSTDVSQDMPLNELTSESQEQEQTSTATAEKDSASEAPEKNAEEETIKGMYLSEAKDLLDSLRGKERLLPYTESSTSKQRDNRDW